MIGFDDDGGYTDDWYAPTANREAYAALQEVHTEIFPPGSQSSPLRAGEQYRTLARRLRSVDLSRCSSRFRNAFDDYVAEVETFADTRPHAGDVVTSVMAGLFGGLAGIPKNAARGAAGYRDASASLERLKTKRIRLYRIAHP